MRLNKINVVGCWPNLARAYEIAKLGDFAIKLVYNIDEYKNGRDDSTLIRAFYGSVIQSRGVLKIGIAPPIFDRVISDRFETLTDVHKRVENARKNTLPTSYENWETSKALVKNAYEKLDLSLLALTDIEEVSVVIAQLEGSDVIKIEHTAEAIQYVGYE